MKKIITIIITILMLSTLAYSITATTNIEMEGSGLPSSFTWQDINGTDYTTSIKNQAPAPTCEAYALCAVLETKMQYQKGEVYNPDLSETHLYFYAGGTYEAGYVNLIDAANYLKTDGVPDEGCYPDPHRAYDYPFISLDGWENRTVKINDWGWVNNTEHDIKKALIDHGPLVFCTYFYRDFYRYQNGVYQKHEWLPPAGGHVMTIVGYNDSQQCWIVKNSWGKNWGIEGWLKMSYNADMITNQWYKKQDENCTGIMYLEGVYGNLKPDVPKVQIQKPQIYKTYIMGKELPSVLKQLSLVKTISPTIIGKLKINITAENTNQVEFYIDGIKTHVDTTPPYTWNLQTSSGKHTLKVKAKNENYSSIDIIDFYKII